MTSELISELLTDASRYEGPPPALGLKLARAYEREGDRRTASEWALAAAEAGDDFAIWQAAAAIVRRAGPASLPRVARSVRVAVLGSYTTAQFTALLPLAAAKQGIAIETYECDYGQYRQEILNPKSRLYEFDPDVIVIAVHEGDLTLPDYSNRPDDDLSSELARWTGLWETIRHRSTARILQHNFAARPESPFGHLARGLVGTRHAMTDRLNVELARSAIRGVSIVDCDWISSAYGKRAWFDPRYWYLAKQAVALGALPTLARQTVAVLSADLGLTRKCIVLDLDNTLWGGVIGEDGLAGIELGEGMRGEAFAAFQEYLLRLKQKGILLAVCSKNNEADAREPFERHPAMRIRLDDLAIFVASWDSKPEQLRRIAAALNIGTDALVFVDDNPVERQAMRTLLPEVDVVTLPEDPADYVRALSDYLGLETASFTSEDASRTGQYRARAEADYLWASAGSVDDFLATLGMQATVEPFNDATLPRVVQLIGKTNQFNLTTRRHGAAALESFVADPACVHFSVRLRDRFTDHGLVALMIGFVRDQALEIDTWLMSCRVIGRTLEDEMAAQVARRASELGCTVLRGTHIPTAKNAMVRDLYPRLGFRKVEESADGTTIWTYDLGDGLPDPSRFIQLARAVA